MDKGFDQLLVFLDIFVKLMVPVGLYLVKGFTDQLKDLDGSVKELNQAVAVQITKDDAKESRLRQVEKELDRLREKMHEIVNDHIGSIVLNSEKISSLEKEVEKFNQ